MTYEGGGGLLVSRVTGLTNFSSWVSGFTFKSYGFSHFEMCLGCGFHLFFFLGFGYFGGVFSSKMPIFSGFLSHAVSVVS